MARFFKSFSERRRARLARQVDRLEAMEPRTAITEPISLTAMILGIAPALATFGLPHGLITPLRVPALPQAAWSPGA